MTVKILAMLGMAFTQPSQPADAGFNLVPMGPGTAVFNPRHHGVPVRVCGIPSVPTGWPPNTYLLSDFYHVGLYARIRTKPPTLDAPCVTGVILRTDGLTTEAARRLGRVQGPINYSPNPQYTLHECNSPGECDPLVTAAD